MKMEYRYEPLREGGTFKLDATTKSAIAAKPTDILGKVVALTGTTEPTVGYGTSGNPVFGVVTAVEKESRSSDDFVVTVEYSRCVEDVPATTNDTAPVVGGGIAVNGAGSVIKAAAVMSGVCLSVANGLCKIRLF